MTDDSATRALAAADDGYARHAAVALANAVLAAHKPYRGGGDYVGCAGQSCWPTRNRTTPWPCDLAVLAQAVLDTT